MVRVFTHLPSNCARWRNTQSVVVLRMPIPKLHIYMAEDDPDDIELFSEALHEIAEDAILTTGHNGVKILSMLRQITPDIIFLDINMPVMNGMECLKRIREIASLRDVPIIIYSTAATEDTVSQCFKLGANRYIKKPAGFAAIKSTIEEILNLPLRVLLKPQYPAGWGGSL